MTDADKPKRKIFTRRRFLWAGRTVVAASGFGTADFVGLSPIEISGV